MIKVKQSRDYYERILDWIYDIDRDHLLFVDTLKDLYKAKLNQDVEFFIPMIIKTIKDTENWVEIMFANYKIHLTFYQIMEQLGASLTPPIVVIPKILKASSEEDAIFKEYLMHKDIEQFILALGG
jgi:hypothetical protein